MTLAYDPLEEVIAGFTHVFVADVGTPRPDSFDEGDFAAWTHLGLTTEDGVRPSHNKTTFDVKSSQRFYPGRRGVSSIELQIEFDLQQWNSETLILALGGGTIEDAGGGLVKFTPADESFIDERALLLHTVDGDNQYLWGYSRTTNTKSFQSSFVRTAEAALPIGMSVLDPGDDVAFDILIDNAAFLVGS